MIRRGPPSRKERLPASIVADLREWIRQGAIDPREETGGIVVRSTVDIEAGRKFWAFQKPVAPALPEVKDAAWEKRDLDRFILATLEQMQLAPSADAAPETLLRRLHFDLVGLPPSPDDRGRFIAAVENEGLDAALADEVDRLLATRLGAAATDCIARGEFGVLVGLMKGDYVTTPLEEVAANKKHIDLSLLELARVLAE